MIRDSAYWRRRLAFALAVPVKLVPEPTVYRGDQVVQWRRGRWGIWLQTIPSARLLYHTVISHTPCGSDHSECQLSRLPPELRRPVLTYVLAQIAGHSFCWRGVGHSLSVVLERRA